MPGNGEGKNGLREYCIFWAYKRNAILYDTKEQEGSTNLQAFRRIVTQEIREAVDRPANFVTADAPNRVWVDRPLLFAKGLEMWHLTNYVARGRRWREKKNGLLTIFVPELDLKTNLWHLHIIQEKNLLLTPEMYETLWSHVWHKEKRKRFVEGRGVDIRDLKRQEWPRKVVDVREYVPDYHSWYVTKQVTESYLPFVSVTKGKDCPAYQVVESAVRNRSKEVRMKEENNDKQVFADVSHLLTVKDLAEYLAVSASLVYQWVEENRIPHYRFGRTVRFKSEEVESWLAMQHFEPPDSTAQLNKDVDRIMKPLKIGSLV